MRRVDQTGRGAGGADGRWTRRHRARARGGRHRGGVGHGRIVRCSAHPGDRRRTGSRCPRRPRRSLWWTIPRSCPRSPHDSARRRWWPSRPRPVQSRPAMARSSASRSPRARPRCGTCRSRIGRPVGALAAPDPVRNLPPLDAFESAPIAALLRDPAVPKAAHHLKYDWQVLRGAGVELAGATYDTMLASFVLDPGRRSHAIDTLSLEHLGRADGDLRRRGRVRAGPRYPLPRFRWSAPPPTPGAPPRPCSRSMSSSHPASPSWRLEPLLRDLEMPLVPVLVDMEWDGIAIDPTLFSRLSAELRTDLARLEADIARVAGVDLNLNSPRQLATVLFEQQQLPVLKKTKTGPSTDADVLEQLAAMGHELPAADPRVPRAPEAEGHLRRRAACGGRTPPPGGFTPTSTRPARRRGGSPRPTRTSRTSRCGRRAAR